MATCNCTGHCCRYGSCAGTVLAFPPFWSQPWWEKPWYEPPHIETRYSNNSKPIVKGDGDGI